MTAPATTCPAAHATHADIDELELSDEDIIDAMQHVPGYLDISTEDFRVIYHLAWQHAMRRLQSRKGGQ